MQMKTETEAEPMDGNKIASIAELKEEKLHAFNREKYGDVIRRFRTEKGINQPQLAAMIGVNKNAVSNWEAGRSRPDINTLPVLCAALGISISDFFGAEAGAGSLSREDQRSLSGFRHLTAANRQIVVKMIDAMLEVQEEEKRRFVAENVRRIFRNEAKTAAGTGNPLDGGRRGRYEYLYADPLIDQADEIITVTGNSMEPTFYDGDMLLVQHSQEIRIGEIGIFVADGDGYVKEYRADGLHSHNPKYPVLRFTEDDNVRCVGRVLGALDRKQFATREEIQIYEDMYPKKK